MSILHPWESGYDNSSLWDGPMNKVKIEKNIQYKRADNKVVNPEHRPLNIDYDRYVTIKNDLRKKKYNPKKIFNTALFNVVDIGFNSIFLKANKDLIILLKEFNLDSSKIINYVKLTERNILRFFDKKKGVFFSFDLRNKKKVSVPSITNYLILFADINNHKINNTLIKNLKKHNLKEKYFFSSIKPNHKSFEEKRYWRGPVWVNCNWFICKGLMNKDEKYSKKIKQSTVRLVEKKGFHEYYSCKNGKPMGANNFSWSAALYLDLKLTN